jgi:hypothetical protein
VRRAVFVDAHRTTRQNDGARSPARDLGPRRVERKQLRVDVQLAHAAGDQLRRLPAKVKDYDVVGREWLVVGRTLGWRRVERDLEVCLYLGIVGRKDAVSGIRRVPMNRLAALTSLDRSLLGYATRV